MHPQLVDALDQVPRLPDLPGGEEDVFRQLQFQPVGVDTGALQDVAVAVQKVGGLHVLAGDVDRYRHLCQPLFRPPFEQQADLFKDQQVQLADQPGALAEGDEFARGDQPPPRVDPAHQGLGPSHLGMAVPLPVFGLQVDAELLPGKGLFQLLQALDFLLLADSK